jgi:sulfoxide reductase heme-binding subunit YedZ
MLKRRLAKVAVFLVCLAPVVFLATGALTGNLSANPIKDITEWTGTWALRFLMITLCVTPLRKLTGWNGANKFRRMLGLFAFFYGILHFLTYVWLDQFFSIPTITQDVYKRPFITAGFIGFVVMIPLAITSTKKWIARLGGKQWQLLHRLTYVSAIAGVVHYLWLVKADTRRPLTYGFLLLMLLGFRVLKLVVSHHQSTARTGVATSARHSVLLVLGLLTTGLPHL